MKTIKTILLTVLVLAIAFGVFWMTKWYYQPKHESSQDDPSAYTIAPVVEEFSGETIRYEISEIGELSTAEYSFTHVENYKSSRQIHDIKIPFTENQYIYSYDGTIKAGIDFTKTDVQVDQNAKTAKVILPRAEILSSEIDEDSFQLYDEKNNIFNPIGVSTTAKSLANMIKSEKEKAISHGLLKTAEQNAKQIMEGFLKSASIPTEYSISVEFAV